MMHLSALEQATGEAKLASIIIIVSKYIDIFYIRYVDDLPVYEEELFAGFVLSECAHGTFTINTTALEEMKACTLITDMHANILVLVISRLSTILFV